MEGSLKNIKRPGVNLDLDEYLKEYTKESFYEKLPVVSLWKLRILTKKKNRRNFYGTLKNFKKALEELWQEYMRRSLKYLLGRTTKEIFEGNSEGIL